MDLSLTPLVVDVKPPMNVHLEDIEMLLVNVKLFAHQESTSLPLLATIMNAHLDTKHKKPTKPVLKIQFPLDVPNPNSYKVENVLTYVLLASGQTQLIEFVKDVQLDVIVA